MTKTSKPGARPLCRACLDDHALILGKLGPMPDATLRAMTGYGLSDQEMARYFGMTPSSLRRLKRSLNVNRPRPD
ncbi:hypothetical protein [Rhodovulum sp.]|uniref:hypothetical protein n=1 Tax=Rhodovulum sp. TaxID=34009 RepID=UPI001842BE65|nr:hypothetical protein [Rhodovulum sp.]HDR29805.1 hypothetical protein [Rhodovulum sp.]